MKTAVVTGASSGIGEATARRLAKEGFDVLIGARRGDRLEKTAEQLGARWKTLDVTGTSSVDASVEGSDALSVTVNTGGAATGRAALAETSDVGWDWVCQAHVGGLARVTRALLPGIERPGAGHVVNVGSIAG